MKKFYIGGMEKKPGRPLTGDAALEDGIKVRLTKGDRWKLDTAAASENTGPVELARRFILDGLNRLTRRKK
jgi:hypothetical protein